MDNIVRDKQHFDSSLLVTGLLKCSEVYFLELWNYQELYVALLASLLLDEFLQLMG